MNDKSEKEPENTTYSKSNVTRLLVPVALVVIVFFLLFIAPSSDDTKLIPKPSAAPRVIKQVIHEITVPANGQCTEPIEVSFNQCIVWDEKVKGRDTFYTQMVPEGMGDDEWMDWVVFRRSEHENMERIRFCSRGKMTIAAYHFKPRRQCK